MSELLKSLNRFARTYRIIAIVIIGIGLAVLAGMWYWYRGKQAEIMRRRMISECFRSCMFNEEGYEEYDYSKEKTCIERCEQKYK